MKLLENNVVVITGGAQGIGASLAMGLASVGAKVVIADVLDGSEVADQINAGGGSGLYIHADVTDDASLSEMVAKADAQFGRIDTLVNNAALFGTLQAQSLMDIDIATWDKVMTVNTRGVWQASKAVIPAMESAGGGSIIHICTNRIFKGFPNMLHYDASKGAVLAMTKAMAAELGDKNIRVNAICPGLTMSDNVKRKDGIEGRNANVVQGRAIKRSSEPEDLIGAVLFFASKQGNFVSGQSLIVDGGGIMV